MESAGKIIFLFFFLNFQRWLLDLGAEVDVQCAWFAVLEPEAGTDVLGLTPLRICHPHIWWENTGELRGMDAFWKLWQRACAELGWQHMLQSFSSSCKYWGKWQVKWRKWQQRFWHSKVSGKIKLAEFSLENPWDLIGNTKSTNLFGQTRFLV